MKRILYSNLALASILVLFVLWGCSTKDSGSKTEAQDASVRGLKDTVGFAISPVQIEAVVKLSEGLEADSLAGEDRLFKQPWIAGISPHDDYLYTGQVYVHIMRNMKAKRMILFGVAHNALRWHVENKLIFDGFTHWRGPYGLVPVSDMREKIIEQLPETAFLISNAYEAEEHSLEALIPFLQYYNRDVEIVPILVPYMKWERMDSLATLLARAVNGIITEENWELGNDIGFFISTDCCHYGDQDWGGKNYAAFGCDVPGYEKAVAREYDIIHEHLTGPTQPARLKKMLYRLVDENDVHQYKISWCGRFSVPFGVDFLHRLTEQRQMPPLVGSLLCYDTSVALGELPVRALGLGQTASSNLHHWVGYTAMGFK
jgi:AmmeMemoRadiSam system protein B